MSVETHLSPASNRNHLRAPRRTLRLADDELNAFQILLVVDLLDDVLQERGDDDQETDNELQYTDRQRVNGKQQPRHSMLTPTPGRKRE